MIGSQFHRNIDSISPTKKEKDAQNKEKINQSTKKNAFESRVEKFFGGARHSIVLCTQEYTP